MHITRLVAGAVSAALLGVTPLAVAAPAQAATTYATQATLETTTPKIMYGDDLTFNGAITTTDGGSVYYGSATLYAAPAVNPTAWSVVQVDETAGNYFFWDVKPVENTLYKVVYSGATATTGDVWTPSESPVVTVGVARKITAPDSGFVLKGKLSPDGARKKIFITVSKSQKRGFKKFRTIKTNGQGKYRTTLPRRGGTWYYRIIVKGDAKYLATGYGWRTWVV